MSLSLKQLIKSGFTTRQAKVLKELGGGGGAQSLQQSPACVINISGSVPNLAAGVSSYINFTDAIVQTPRQNFTYGDGDMPFLDMTGAGYSGGVNAYPAGCEDRAFDINARLIFSGNPADAGKLITVTLRGINQLCWASTLARLKPDGSAVVGLAITDLNPLSNGEFNDRISVLVDASALSHFISPQGDLLIVQRGPAS